MHTNISYVSSSSPSYLPWFEVFYKLLNILADYTTKGQVFAFYFILFNKSTLIFMIMKVIHALYFIKTFTKKVMHTYYRKFGKFRK